MSEQEKAERVRDAAHHLLDACKAFVAARSNADLHNAVKLAEAAIALAERSNRMTAAQHNAYPKGRWTE